MATRQELHFGVGTSQEVKAGPFSLDFQGDSGKSILHGIVKNKGANEVTLTPEQSSDGTTWAAVGGDTSIVVSEYAEIPFRFFVTDGDRWRIQAQASGGESSILMSFIEVECLMSNVGPLS